MKTRYIVKENERKVICVIHTDDFDEVRNFSEFAQDYCNSIMWYRNRKVMEQLKLPHKAFVGIATCAPEDEWDEALGKKLAYARAKYKYDDAFFKRANLLINEMDKHIDGLYTELNKYGAKLSNSSVKRHEELQEKLGKDIRIT